MLDKIEYLEDGEAKYPMAFTVNVLEITEEKYGGMQEWVKFIDRPEPSYKALKFMLLETINEGIDIENERLNSDHKKPLMTSKQIGRLMTRVGFENISLKLFDLIQDAMPKGEQGKNAVTTQNPKK